jgi:hypothetical protein
LLRIGAANFSAPGEKREDNDLVVIESVEAAAGCKRVFDARYSGGEVLSLGAKLHAGRFPRISDFCLPYAYHERRRIADFQ